MPRPIDESPQEDDLERFGSETRPCPQCGAQVYDEAPFCHKCGRALDAEGDRPAAPPWVVFGALGLIAALVLGLILFRNPF